MENRQVCRTASKEITMNLDERYTFGSSTKKKLLVFAAVGVVVTIIGLIMVMSGGGEHGAENEHAATLAAKNLLADANPPGATLAADESEESHGSAPWLKRLFVGIWINNIFFIGIAIIGVFFVAIQYASQAGWSAGMQRIPEAFGYWLPIGAIITLVMFFVAGHDIFHWTHTDLYTEGGANYDKIISGKRAYFFWPLQDNPGFPIFFIVRMVAYFALWIWFFMMLRKHSLAEDLDANTSHWYKMRSLSAIFLIIFAVTSSTAAWDWIMSIDTHWFSTMFGWYTFASWWVSGLAMTTLIVIYLKEKGLLSLVNENHLHDLGKFVWAFTIFWTYIWFGQFLLIYYANIPEESIYFHERMKTSNYSGIFYFNLIINFFLPFLILMTRDAKRKMTFLKLVCTMLLIGHWFDFYLMITPGSLQFDGGFGLLEIGVTMIFLAGFLYVALVNIAKAPLIAKNHPMLDESRHHHI